jgi:hypothetical protein
LLTPMRQALAGAVLPSWYETLPFLAVDIDRALFQN